MPDSNPASSQDENQETGGQSKEKYVSQDAFEEVSTDMHKYKQRMKDAEAKAAEYEATLKSREESEMREKQQWQELSDKYKAELDKERSERAHQHEQYLDALKRGALKDELKGVDSKYLIHADVSAIEIGDNGQVNNDSVHTVANKFREENPVLMKATPSAGATSLSSPFNSTVQPQEKSLSEMSTLEKQQYLKSLKSN